jgi:hypothetical protein
MKAYLSVAIAMLAASPAFAQNNAAAPTNAVETTAANAAAGNVSDNVTPAPAANDAVAAPADTATALPASPPAQSQPRSFPWGVLGLLGLIGLFGSRKSAG